MTIYVAPHRDHVRLGVDACPGVDERGHGLTMRTLHDDGCCAEWAGGEASTPARAEAFRETAARWGSTWPKAQPEAADPEPEAEDEATYDRYGPFICEVPCPPEPEAEAEASL